MLSSKSTMLRLIRVPLLSVIFFFTLSLVVAIGRSETGPLEKVALAGAVLGLVALARPVHRMG